MQNATGLVLPPCWRICLPAHAAPVDDVELRLGGGAGFGDGSHPTTRLCLQALAMLWPGGWRPARAGAGPALRVLDFGSGNGILAIAAARLGGTAVGVEIDGEALATAAANVALNDVGPRVRFTRDLADAPGPFELVVANILRPVLLAHADALAARLAPGGTLILSGLVSTDVPDLAVRFEPLLGGGRRPEVYRQDGWCALVWRPPTSSTSG